ncbi:prolyl oligopeptidase family serine peptidase [Gangjinia marincola]|uniref:Prolyl oligopeptidase family serine peptidase n=1 Tax=Gangjinia marincola TaxID=578463 RepID=A0ABP3XVL7_9FLAO
MKKNSVLLLFLLVTLSISAQENLTYQKPSKEILALVDVPLAPTTLVDSKGEMMIFLYRDAYKSIAELSEEELRLGGLRVNPKTNIGSRNTYYTNVKIKNVKDKEAKTVSGLPVNPRLANFSWSPNEEKVALTNTTDQGVELWILDVKNASVTRIETPFLNANMGNPIDWFKDNTAVLIKTVSKDVKPLIDTKTSVPTGPTITTSDGKKAQNRTYQDLLKNPNDEHNFKQLALAELMKVSLDGKTSLWKEAAMYRGIDFSPDGNYVMVTTIHTPFSYLVPYRRFPSTTTIYDKDGNMVSEVLNVPLIEDLPKGFMAEREGRRDMSWRNDRPATLIYVEALDGGDPANEVAYRDEVFMLEAPFNGDGLSFLKTKHRFSGITWGDDTHAIARDYWWNTRNTKTYLFNPSDSSKEAKIITDRNYQDRYSDPGRFVTTKNNFGEQVLSLHNNAVYLMGEGFTKEGQFPFVDKMNLTSLKTTRIYTSPYKAKKESLIKGLDMKKGSILTRVESAVDYPNYYIRNFKRKSKPIQISFFDNPFKALENVSKEVITYQREDGLTLNGTLYLPEGYNKTDKLPMIMWAYPREYKDKNSAGQNTSNPNSFTYPYYGSPIYWVTKGYAVLDNAAFPIVGEGDEQPNDSFRSQLVANAKAAIDAVDKLGYVDRERVAVGGHSYGAFMTANLLSHSNLFAAGIARSGAYNRTLTPFGFQSEERSYWEAPEVYYTMSPFMHADKMKTPLLLIHGEADNNSGTYPLQSERYFNALKGLGATARLVMLPKESHGYRAKESVLHVLWEQDQWLEQYVKNKDTSTLEKEGTR